MTELPSDYVVSRTTASDDHDTQRVSGAQETANAQDSDLPLIVDLDGSLIRSDLLVETAFGLIGKKPLSIIGMCRAVLNGKAALKDYIALQVDIAVPSLPFNGEVRTRIETAKSRGRRVYLASASNEKYVQEIANFLELDGYFASDSSSNLSGKKKAKILSEKFGEGGFDYIGNDFVDLPIWNKSREVIVVDPPRRLEKKVKSSFANSTIIRQRRAGPRSWIKLIRVHQWVKNTLVFLPLLTSQQFNSTALANSVGAFFAFSFAASAIYIVNDLVDIESDRDHPTKKSRPLAAGTVPILKTMTLVPFLLIASFAMGSFVSSAFVAVLCIYLIATTLYSFSLKRKLLVDVVTLAGLYSVRVIGGAAAISVGVSTWLLAFSLFVFTCLALLKRYTELTMRFDANLPDSSSRNYKKTDLPIVATLAAVSGMNSVVVFALYISDEKVSGLYKSPLLLWLICPALLYWIGRTIMLAHRREMNDDPIVFALRDRNSRVAGTFAAIVWAAAVIGLPI